MTSALDQDNPALIEELNAESVALEDVEATGGPTGLAVKARRLGRRMLRTWPALALFVLIFSGWEFLVRSIDVPVLYVPAPSVIFDQVVSRLDFWWDHSMVTLKEALLGLLIGGGIAGVAAVFMAEFSIIDRALLPLFVVIKVTPGVTLVPLFVIWLGFGMGPKVILASLTVFYAMLINAITGFKSVDEETLEVMRSVNASRLEIFMKLRFPNSLPYLFSALKIGVPLAVLGAVFAEMYNSKEGLGNVILQAGHNINMVTLWGGIFVLAFLGVLFVSGINMLERRMLRWHSSQRIA